MISKNFCADLPLSAVLPEAKRFSDHEVPLARCTPYATRVQPGDVYVAVVEADRDGHDQVGLAVQRGARAVVAERYVCVPVPLYLVEDGRRAYGRLSHALAGNPSSQMLTIGVSGGHGKSCVAQLVATIFKTAGVTVGWASSLGWSDGRRCYRGQADRWSVDEVASRLSTMRANGCQVAVLECSRRSVSEGRWAGCQFDIQVFTDMRPLHDDRSGWPGQQVQQAARSFQDLLKKTHAVAINGDDPYTQRALENWSCDVVSAGLGPNATVHGKVVERDACEQTFLMTYGPETVAVTVATVGDWWVRNCLLAATAATAAGVPLAAIGQGLQRVRHIPGRLERIACGQPYLVFVDEADHPARLSEMLNSLRDTVTGRLICVFSPNLSAPRLERARWGRVAEKLADRAILTVPHATGVDLHEVYYDVMDGFRRPAKLEFLPDRRQAIAHALYTARAGDCVLVAGKLPREQGGVDSRNRLPGNSDLIRELLYAQCQESVAVESDSRGNCQSHIIKFPRR
jgi:UDP-N-acetylmuramoyl-L-alanyl-D-glutamate--2,6-diaminopimelate ligase